MGTPVAQDDITLLLSTSGLATAPVCSAAGHRHRALRVMTAAGLAYANFEAPRQTFGCLGGAKAELGAGQG